MKSKLIRLSLIGSSLLCCGIVASNSEIVLAENEVAELKDEYDYLEEISIPSYSFNIDGKVLKAEGTTIFPNGFAYNKQTVKLDQIGLYKVLYKTTYNKKNYSKTKSFIVRRDLVYGSNNFTKISTNEVPGYAVDYTNSQGVYVELAKGDEVTFEKEFDANSFVGQKFITGFITPKVVGEFDMTTLVVLLRDSVDPSIYLRWELNTNPNNKSWRGISYMKTGANGQTIGGWNDEKGAGNEYFQTNFGTKLGAVPFANEVYVSENVYKDNIDPKNYQFDITLNYATLQTTSNKKFVADYDDAKYYSSFWDGFPSGKCKLSITADKYVDSFARFCITSVDQIDISQKKSDITNNDVISVDFDTNNMPEASLGRKYPIPSASAFSGLKVNKKVYYNYKTTSQLLVSSNAEYFIPTRFGTYTIVYYTTNAFGEVYEKDVVVHCGNQIDDITATIPASLVSSCNIGDIIDVPEITDAAGGSGELSIKIYAKKDNENIEINNGKFQPLSAGKWAIVYEISDYSGNIKEFSQDLSVELSDTPAFAEVVNIPETFFNELPVELPKVYGYEFINGIANKKLCDVEIVDENGTNTYTSGTFAPKVLTNGGTFTVNFKINNTVVYTYSPNVLIAYDGYELHFENYFIGEGYTLEKTNDGAEIIHTDSVAKWSFYSKLIADNFRLVLNNDENGGTDFGNIKVQLTDVNDKNLSVSFSITTGDAVNTININGKSYDFSFDFTTNTKPLTVSFSEGEFNINNVYFAMKNYDNGKPFSGFPSDFVHVSVTTSGSVGTKYYVSSLNGHTFIGNDDTTNPEFHICDTYGGKFDYGTIYTISRVVYNDVISPTTTGSLSVKNEDGSYATSTDGILLQNVNPTRSYDIKLSKFGIYSIIYSFTDESIYSPYFNTLTYTYKVTCADFVAPEIKATSSWTKEAKVGDVIVMPSFEVNDNYSSADKITVYKSVINPYGIETLLEPEENAIKVNYQGKYVFKVIAMDEAGNISMAQFECVVK